MQLKYVGPKEIISPHGINFKTGKDDKYVYIKTAIQIYNAIAHDYEKNIIYHHNIKELDENDELLLDRILHLQPKLPETCEKEIKELEAKLDLEIEHVKQLKDLTSEETMVFKNNLIIMKKYRLQRETNKIIYRHVIDIVVDEIIKNRLKEINVPFNEKYWHVFQTIEGDLSNHHGKSIGSTIETNHDNPITITLKINPIF